MRRPAPDDPSRPSEIRVEFAHSDGTEKHRHRVEILGGRTIPSTAPDWWAAWRQFYF